MVYNVMEQFYLCFWNRGKGFMANEYPFFNKVIQKQREKMTSEIIELFKLEWLGGKYE